ncbi:hypothetical protein SK128_023680 [Halocaridina rubra]|uniref:Uncharacterized protein n=1 Tax=Halocaridina rubra TaxID=373956 RepID=A0AAN8X3V8_HALRR
MVRKCYNKLICICFRVYTKRRRGKTTFAINNNNHLTKKKSNALELFHRPSSSSCQVGDAIFVPPVGGKKSKSG